MTEEKGQREQEQGWLWISHNEIAEINPPKPDIDDPTAVSFVPMGAVEAETGEVSLSAERKVFEVRKGYTAFQDGDILFAKITPCMENGKVALIHGLKNGIGFGSSEFHVSRLHKALDARFYLYYFLSHIFRKEAQGNMTGSAGQLRVPTIYFREVEVPLPPVNEQRRIVAKIEELFSELDKGVESLKAARAQLKTYRQSLLKAAFEGRLTEQWRRDNADKLETADQLLQRIREEREARYDQQMANWKAAVAYWEAKGKVGKKPKRPKRASEPSQGATEERISLPPIPDTWRWETLGWMTLGVEYGTSAKSKKSGDVPVIRMGNLQNGQINWGDLAFTSDQEEIEEYLLDSGDVLFNRTNSPELVGKTALYRGERKAIFAGYLIRLNHFKNFVDSRYLTYFLNSKTASDYAAFVKTDGVNQSNINGKKLAGYPFPYCALIEQQTIAYQLDCRMSEVDELTRSIDVELRRAELLRQSILKRAFSGKLVPQDPDDEPASVLLERIRAEQEEAPKARGRRRKANA